MFRTKYAALTHAIHAILMASLLGCADDVDRSGRPATGGQTARGGTTTPTVGDTPISTAGNTATSTAGDSPNSADGELPTPAGSETPTAASGGIDPTGVWWTEVTTLGSEVLPILGRLDGTNIRFVMRVEVSGAAPNNEVTFEFCQLQTEWIDPVDPNNITTIGFRPNVVATFSESITTDLGALSPGAKVPLPSLGFRGGMDESRMELDEDGDGNPAVTAWVRTLAGLQIEVYETITISANLDLTVPDENTLSGTVDFGADALIIASNNIIIAAGTVVTITPASKAVPLTVKRLPGGGDCASLPSTIKFTTVPPPPPPLFPPLEPAP